MGKSLIITEKPSVAQEFARILHVSGRQNGFLENDTYVITWCVGHLVEMVYPEEYDSKLKKWRLEDLPFLPETYKYHVIPAVSRQYDIVHKMLHREDIETVYWAGDAGKEGQTIEENIRNFGGVREGMKELRVWIDSQTEEEILRGIREARPMSDYANLGKSGIMRTIEDYAMGINFSRAMSVKYGNLLNDAAGTKSYTAIAVGRVMTCVLGMVVIREREIRNFVDTPFYRVTGRFTDAVLEAEWKAIEGSKYFESPLLYKENGFKKQENAENLIAELNGKEAVVENIEKGNSRKKAPLLFNLAELQAECAKRFKISPDETLQVAQDLYEKKLTTYPRTDARVLSTPVAKEISKNLNKLKGYEPTSAFTERILQQGLYRNLAATAYTDDSKVTDHYAIIPTGQLTELKSLNTLQRQVFDLIVRRFLSIFYPAAEYSTVKLQVKVGEESFFASAKVLKSPGYLEIAGRGQKEDNEEEKEGETSGEALLSVAENLKKGDKVSVGVYGVKEGKTSPPKRYTTGSMVLAMENAGQLIEDEELRAQIKGSGIGTSATRAEIIKKLIRIGYLNLNKKTQILTPHTLGEMIYETVDMTVPELLNPRMTASWEKGLDGITKGTVDMGEYRRKLEDFIRKETLAMVERDQKGELISRISPLTGKESRGIAAKKKIGAACPVCGAEMETTPFGYGCSNYKKDGSGCKFAIGSIAGRNLEEEECVKLLTTGKTDVLSGFVSRSKKKFEAMLVLEKKEGEAPKLVFDFSANAPKVVEGIQCPNCGSAIEKTPYGYVCSRKRETPEGCNFSVGKIADKILSEKELSQLLTEGKTGTLRGFKSKNGKKFDACLLMEKDENGKTNIKFDFENVEAKRVKDVLCPVCGGEILVTPFGYACENRRKEEEGACTFAIGKIADKDLSESNVRELLNTGKTSTIRGFKSKNGKRFDACLSMKKDENGVPVIQFDFENVEAKKLKDVKCPLCGGDIAITRFGYSCANYDREKADSCKFAIGKIAGVKLKDSQVKELLQNGKTGPIEGFIAKTGMMFTAALKLDEDKKVVFDFPQKEEPRESSIECPLCKKKLMRDKWKLTCECGYAIGHTVAQVALSDEAIRQLITDGKTKEMVTGFVSKAGNTFDAFLKAEKDEKGKVSISFDFDRALGGKQEESTLPWVDEKIEEMIKSEETDKKEPEQNGNNENNE